MADHTEAESTEHGDSAVIKELRAKAKRVEEAETRAATAERELAFLKADLGSLNDKQRKALLAAHDGEIEPEALKATALELGFQAQAPQPTGEETPESAEVDGELAHLSNFAGAPAPEGREVLTQEKVDEMVKAVPPDQLDEWMFTNAHLFGINTS